ncbi:MAG: NAD-dependent epimerase/dehydratase family protein [Gemmatimonadetes bacterium]|nr:NAD-dependent epimerase/dehydratase family protein [Gemmatimonadota bacterium]
MRVAIVGCGRVAEYHARFIAATPGAELVAVADARLDNARRLAKQYADVAVYQSLTDLLSGTAIDVLHVTTPPAGHASQALAAIARGAHVLVEKPVALAPADAEQIYRCAAEKGVSICPNFIQLFHPRMREADAMIASGRLGSIRHCECYLGVDLNMRELTEARRLHWSYELPGGVLQNYITHPLYLVQRWIGEARQVHVAARSFGNLPQGLTDHLDVLIEGEGGTASLTLSFATRPAPYYVKVYGENGTVTVDFDALSVMVDGPSALPRSVDRATVNLRRGVRLSRWAFRNVREHLLGRLVPYHGLGVLIPKFYDGIQTGKPAPVPPELALAVSRSEHQVLSRAGKVRLDLTARPSRQATVRRAERVLVTGATGFVGREVVRQLVDQGYYVRALSRPLGHIEALEGAGVEIVFGDLRDKPTIARAVEGMDVVVHVGAAVRGSDSFMRASAVGGTANLAEAAARNGVKRVIYMSSLSVYDYLRMRNGELVSATSPLEERPADRGGYSAAKREAEDVATSALGQALPAWTILRPSVIFGPDRDPVSAAGPRIGRWLLSFGGSRHRLRLVHVADVARAVVLAIQQPVSAGKVYTVSHPDTIRIKEFVQHLGSRVDSRPLRVVYLPYWVAACGVLALWVLGRLRNRPVGWNRRRLAYLFRDVRVDSSAIAGDLGWRPAADLRSQLIDCVDRK